MKELSKMLRRKCLCIYLSVRKTCTEKVPIDRPGCWVDLVAGKTWRVCLQMDLAVARPGDAVYRYISSGCREDPDNVSIDGPGCREDLDKVSIDGPGKYRHGGIW